MSERKRVGGLLVGCVVALATAMPATGQDAGDPSAIRARSAEYSPYLNYDYPGRVFFGDSHVHTSYSTDVGLFGNTLRPDEAYRFAKGETVTSSTGVRARLLRPLDWLAVADHAENIGLAPMISESNADLLRSEWGREIHDLVRAGNLGGAYAMWGSRASAGDDPLAEFENLMRSMWEQVTAAAEAHNRPGVFTALIGYEWTSSPNRSNLHRTSSFERSVRLRARHELIGGLGDGWCQTCEPCKTMVQ